MTQEIEQDEKSYDYSSIQKKWQTQWNNHRLFEADVDENTPKYFINFPFPYVNGSPHLGHGYSLIKAEIMARFQRMLGKNVLFPFAFHATGEPIVGTAKRIKAKDESQIRSLITSGVPENEIEKFTDPEYIIDFFRGKWTNTAKALGLAVDWRRQFVTTQLTPVFSKFIEWQYRKMKQEGYVIQGSHPVIWCPTDLNPTGDHDRLEGEGVRVVEFVLLKFKSDNFDAYFLPGTLRPETVYGVTNMFVHPDAKYVKVEINKEKYIIAEEAVIKFRDQQYEIGVIEELHVKDLIGTYTRNPVTGNDVIVLPGDFIDSGGATGVVMSVPAHAPVDWFILDQLKSEDSSLQKWGVSQEEVSKIEPIGLIDIDGFGEFPAKEAIEQFEVKSMKGSPIKQATKLVYRKEHSAGVLNDKTGKYKGKSVSEVKDELIQDFEDEGYAIKLKDPGDLVVCRCGTRNHVKFLENQWFLEFGSKDWKDKVHKMLDGMDVFPEDARLAFHNTIDWLENKACARRSGLGTPMPWDNEWIIETLSDSVIYMAYYMVSKYVNDGSFKTEFAKDEVFDYLMTDKGDPEDLSEKYKISVELLEEIKSEIVYFYGFDLRTSGKDLLNNHLTYMLMHHRVVFPEKYWPKGLAVNGYVSVLKPETDEIMKMSKSKGYFKTIEDVIDAFGVDATRIGFAIAGEGLKDAQFALSEGASYNKWLQNLYHMAMEKQDDNEEHQIDKWLMSRVQVQIKKAHDALSAMETRTAFQAAHHEILQDLKWYTRRRSSKGPAYSYAVKTMVKLITPFAPHFAEEVWEEWGEEGFVINSKYPEYAPELIDEDSEYGEKFLTSLMDDLRGLKRFLTERGNPEPKVIEIFIAPEWMYEVYSEAFENGLDQLIKRVMKSEEMRKLGKPVPKYCQALMKAGGPPDYPWNFNLENNTLNESKEFIEREMNAEVNIIMASDSSHDKAKIAVPRRPGVNFIA